MNRLLRVLCSLPILLVLLYYIPFLGVCLVLFKIFLGLDGKQRTPIILIICSLLILVPYVINYSMSLFNITDIDILYINTILSSDIYSDLLNYSKFLLTVGVVCLIISVIVKNIYNKINLSIINYIKQLNKRDYEINKENNLKMQEKREKAKNTHIVYCPHCGSDNLLTEQIGICKFCRRKIEYKQKE